jgi:hypothetical protein
MKKKNNSHPRVDKLEQVAKYSGENDNSAKAPVFICQECYQELKGEKEVLKHYKETFRHNIYSLKGTNLGVSVG